MKKISIDTLDDGTVYSQPLFLEEGLMFVPDHTPVREADLIRLKKMGVTEVLSEGMPLNQKQINKNKLHNVSLKWEANADKKMQKIYQELIDRMNSFFNSIQDDNIYDISLVNETVESIYTAYDEHPDDFLLLILKGKKVKAARAENAVNAAILALALGSQYNFQRTKLNNLIMGALLHDIGMLKIPQEILDKKEKLSEKEIKLMRSHTAVAYNTIMKSLHLSGEVGLIGLEHHERWDGKGYPKNLKGENISLMARIVSVVDAFEAMVSKKPYRSPLIGNMAIKNIMNDNGRRFDPEVVRRFVSCMGLYPVGSFVKLNSGAYGRVQKTNPEAPMRPYVQILIDSDGMEYEDNSGEIINLMESSSVFINQAISLQDLVKNDRE